jgi:hypothetical protein
MRVMHWFMVNGLTFCGRPQLPGFDRKRDCKSCMRFRADPRLKVAVVVYGAK